MQSSELETTAKLILHTKEVLNVYLSSFTEQPLEKVQRDTDRDFYMSPEEAKEYGLIDEVITHKNVIHKPKVPELKIPPSYFFLDKSVRPLPSVPIPELKTPSAWEQKWSSQVSDWRQEGTGQNERSR